MVFASRLVWGAKLGLFMVARSPPSWMEQKRIRCPHVRFAFVATCFFSKSNDTYTFFWVVESRNYVFDRGGTGLCVS